MVTQTGSDSLAMHLIFFFNMVDEAGSQSGRFFLDLQLSFLLFVHPRSFKKFKF